nr:MAG TPA: hypothetical protein [Caudoviricetes sp.]
MRPTVLSLINYIKDLAFTYPWTSRMKPFI